MAVTEHFFDTRSLASAEAARRLSGLLVDDLKVNPCASLVVSGGSSPVECFGLLSDTDLEWNRVTILMSDERCVAPHHEASNEGMIRRELLTHFAAGVTLLPIFQESMTPDELCTTLSDKIDTLRRPFSAALLGMGDDGHFASLFPDNKNLAEGLAEDGQQHCLPALTAASPHPRISLTHSTLLQSVEVLLLFFGQAKRQVYEQARTSLTAYPVSRLLQQERTPVHVIWAP